MSNKFGNMAEKMIKSYSEFAKLTSENKKSTPSSLKKQFNLNS